MGSKPVTVGQYTPTQVESAVADLKSRLNENDILGSFLNELALARLDLLRLDREIAILRAANELRDALLPEAHRESMGVSSVELDSTIPLSVEQGFYHLEHDDTGRSYRWTGPGNQFFFNILLDRTEPIGFRMRLSGGTPEAAVKGLRCFADRREVPLLISEETLGWAVTGILPSLKTSGLTRVEFLVPVLFRPADKNPASTDTRLLGVVFIDIGFSLSTTQALTKHTEAVARIAADSAAERARFAAGGATARKRGIPRWLGGGE
jgi:hypothetical protein